MHAIFSLTSLSIHITLKITNSQGVELFNNSYFLDNPSTLPFILAKEFLFYHIFALFSMSFPYNALQQGWVGLEACVHRETKETFIVPLQEFLIPKHFYPRMIIQKKRGMWLCVGSSRWRGWGQREDGQSERGFLLHERSHLEHAS